MDEATECKVLPLPRGAYSQIARRLKLTPTHVREVALGNRKSARVAKAIRRFLDRQPQERAA